ncbi:MAG: family ATPase, partial [Chloroflexi bacterium]|nr:family ATPase [Chloroflexota bacterium]
IDIDVLESLILHHPSGLDILAAPPSPQTAELVTAAAVSAVLPLARSQYKWVVVDTSATFSELNLGVIDRSDLLLLVAAPDLTSLKVTRSMLDVFSALLTPAEKRVLILNQTPAKAHLKQDDFEQALGERIGLMLPYADDAVLDSIDHGVPLATADPSHPFITALESFAMHLADVKTKAQVQAKRGGLGQWVQGVIGSLRR